MHRAVRLLAAVAILFNFATALAVIALDESEPSSQEAPRRNSASRGFGPTEQWAALTSETPPPIRVEAPSIGVSSELTDLRLQPDGNLEVPEDFAVAGWWVEGIRPGDPGPAVVVGHVDSLTGPGVFFKLGLLEQGSQILIQRQDGSSVTFQVTKVGQYPKSQFPTELVYGSTPEPTLRLITCGGAFDRKTRSYKDNVVVFARQVSPPATSV